MKNFLSALFLGILLCGVSLAQDTPPSSTEPGKPAAQPATPPDQASPSQTAPEQTPAPNQAPGNSQPTNTLKLAPGSVIPAQLSKTVDAKKVKTGDQVTATVTQDMKTTGGEVLVPKDTKIIGHVTQAQARNKEQKESQVGIAFDHAVVKGNEMQLPMSIQAIVAPQTNNPAGASPSEPSSPSPSATGTSQSSPMGGGGRTAPSSASSAPSQSPNYPQGGGTDAQAQNSQPQINGNTQGIIGMSDVKLDNNSQDAAQGSLVSSEKNNVKIEKGTLLLLRVHQ